MQSRAYFLLPHFRPSGGIRHILELAAGVAALGREVVVRCVGTPSRYVRAEDLRPERLSEWWPGYPSSRVRYEVGSLRALRPAPGDVVVTYGDAENEQFQSSYLRDCVSVMLVLDWLAFSPDRQLRYLRQGTWDAVACSTPFLRDNLAKEGLSAWVVGAGVDRAQFRRVPVPSGGDVLTIGIQHSWIPNKGWRDALEVAAQAALLRGGPVRLLSFGAEDPAPDAEPPPPGVRLHLVTLQHVHRPDAYALRSVYSASDVWLCASASEGYGFPSLEAMSCGVPVVTYRNGGHSAYLAEGENGYSVEVGDVGGAAEAALRCVSSPAEAARLSAGAEATAAALSWPAAALRMEECLSAVLRSRGLS